MALTRADMTTRLVKIFEGRLARLSDDHVVWLHERLQFVMQDALGDALVHLRPPTPLPPPHAEFRLPFDLDELRLEAIGFLDRGVWSVSGDEMFRRTDQDGRVIRTQEEWQYICARLLLLPLELKQRFRQLATTVRYTEWDDWPEKAGSAVRCLSHIGLDWYDSFGLLNDPVNGWGHGVLVLRHRA